MSRSIPMAGSCSSPADGLEHEEYQDGQGIEAHRPHRLQRQVRKTVHVLYPLGRSQDGIALEGPLRKSCRRQAQFGGKGAPLEVGQGHGLLASDPRHPALNCHEIGPLSRRYGEKVWQSCLEIGSPAARRGESPDVLMIFKLTGLFDSGAICTPARSPNRHR
jgi:hypothetical protein